LPLTWRLDFKSKGSPIMTCMWVVWDDLATFAATTFMPIRKPLAYVRTSPTIRLRSTKGAEIRSR
jgi:hypothetical protein